jgi:ribonucleoside-diphosphate reductase alpha chain
VGGSLIITDRGIVRLSTLGDTTGAQWQPVNFQVLTDEGVQQATQFYINGVEATRRIRTISGYEIQGTLTHRIKVVDARTGEWVWKRFADIVPDDIVPLAMDKLVGEPHTVPLPPLGELYWTSDSHTRVPRVVTPELAELVGYFMGDGSLHAKGLRFYVTQQDQDVVERLCTLIRNLFGINAKVTPQQGCIEVTAHSVPLTIWWEACGFAKHRPTETHQGKGWQPHIPNSILYTNDRTIYCAFLRGLFEADGTVTAEVPAWTTVSETFYQEVKMLLLALGFPTSAKQDTSAWGQAIMHGLRLKNRSYVDRFLQDISFIGERKRAAVRPANDAQSGRHDYIYLSREHVESLVPIGNDHRNAALLGYRRHSAITRRLATTLFAETGDEELAESLCYFYDCVEANMDGGEQFTYDLSVPANVTYVANGFVSHNTIAFMMDCDTTGVEPDIALVKYKKLVGGGLFKIVNNTVPLALKQLGYDAEQIERIVSYIDKNDTIEGSPYLREEHLPVFDCAFKPFNGMRSIHYMGHIKMMAVTQPYLSGAISKTVNMPTEVTSDDIMQAYIEAWKLGLKAIAIYRDGCKRTQPLSTSLKTEEKKEQPQFKPRRRRLPDERRAITHKFSIAGHEGYITVGMYEDGQPGEIFITMAKEGTVVSGLMDSFATAISLALQYGVPLKVLVDKFSHTRFEPSGFTNNRDIPMAKSIMDYIFRWLALKFLPKDDQPSTVTLKENGDLAVGLSQQKTTQGISTRVEMNEKAVLQMQADAPPCTECGSIMVRNGSCYKCLECGSTSGCS